MLKKSILRNLRDAKTIPHIEQYAPVWLADEIIITAEDAIQFNTIFRHNQYGWVSRRYRYDAFNDVLYYKGQTTLPEADVLEIQEQDAYIFVSSADVPNAYGG